MITSDEIECICATLVIMVAVFWIAVYSITYMVLEWIDYWMGRFTDIDQDPFPDD